MVENQEKVTSSDAAGSTHESVSAAVTSAGCYSVSGNSAHEVLQQVAIGAAGSYDAAALEALQYPLSSFVSARSGEGGESAALPPRAVHTSRVLYVGIGACCTFAVETSAGQRPLELRRLPSAPSQAAGPKERRDKK